jgi:hypothetical protein
MIAFIQLIQGRVDDATTARVLILPSIWALIALLFWPFLGIYLTRDHVITVSWFRIRRLRRASITDVKHEEYSGLLSGFGRVEAINTKVRVLRIFHDGRSEVHGGSACTSWAVAKVIEDLKAPLGIQTPLASSDPIDLSDHMEW